MYFDINLKLLSGKDTQKVKFIYSEKATTFCEIFTLILTTVHTVKSKGKISKNCVAFSEYMNFTFLFYLSLIKGPRID